MSYPVSVMPDDELALLQYLRTVTVVTALCPAANIIGQLPPTNVQAFPYVLVQRVGGQVLAFQYVDEPALQVDVYASTRGQAKRLMLAVRAGILAIANDVVAEAVMVSAYEEVGPSWLPDVVTVPVTARYTARFRVLLHK